MKLLKFNTVRQSISFFLIFALLINLLGCNHFQVRVKSGDKISSIKDIGKIHKTMIVHSGEKLFLLRDIQVDSINLYGTLHTSDSTIVHYVKESRGTRYKAKQKDILNEVHFYLKTTDLDTTVTKIALADVKEVRIIEKNTAKTVAAYFFGTLGITAGVLVLVLIYALATKSSCPYVYVDDGEGFVFEGETFGGALAQNLERDDYMPLPHIQIYDDAYNIRISNELLERQYTDLAELIVVNHPKNRSVLLDKTGQPQLLGDMVMPTSAQSSSGSSILTTVQHRDSDVFFFNDEAVSQNSVSLKFKKPSGSANAKLVLNAKNTMWFDYMYGEFIEKFGASYNHWMEQQSKAPTQERLQKIKERQIPLSIYVKKQGEWQLVDELLTVGPMASRDFVIPIDLAQHQGEEVEIKLETGFMFWELNSAGISFLNNSPLEVQIQKPQIAYGTGARNWTKTLSESDKDYMLQDSIGEVTQIAYKTVKHQKEEAQSIFLHTRGYYTLIRNFEGLPDIAELQKFKKTGHFSDFSKARYLDFIKDDAQLVAIPKK